jgi:hypothetical protein
MSMPASGQEDTTQLEESGFMSGLTRKQKIIVGTVAGGVLIALIILIALGSSKVRCNNDATGTNRTGLPASFRGKAR